MGVEVIVGTTRVEVIEVHPTVPSPPGPAGPQGVKGDPGGWVNASPIGTDVNLNTLTTAGTYVRTSSVGATLALNYPTNEWAGWIEVISNGTSAIQRATSIYSQAGAAPTMNNMWYRANVGGTWQQWTPISTPNLGYGQPNGSVIAAVGGEYTDLNATNGAVKWVKTVGVGNTGWVVSVGDTGWRDISGTSMLHEGIVMHSAAPTCKLRRIGDQVQFVARLAPKAGGTLEGTPRATALNLLTGLPAGFIAKDYVSQGSLSLGTLLMGHVHTMAALGNLTAQGHNSLVTGNWAASDGINVTATWTTNNAWPTSLPGTATS